MGYNQETFEKTANQKTLTIWCLSNLVLTVLYEISFNTGMHTPAHHVMFLLFCWIPFFAGLFVLSLHGLDSRFYKIAAVVGFGIFYAFLIFTSSSPLSFLSILPVIGILTLYKDKRYTIGCGIVNILLIIGYGIFNYGSGVSTVTEDFYFSAAFVLLAYCCDIFVIHGLQQADLLLSESIEVNLQQVTQTIAHVKNASNSILDSVNVARELTETDSPETNALAQNMTELSENINHIEQVISQLIEKLGASGFMGIQDIHPGMRVTLYACDKKTDTSKDYHGQILERDAEGIVIALHSDQPTLNNTGRFQTFILHIIVDNVLYYWNEIRIKPIKAHAGQYRIDIQSKPDVINRRKYPRLPLSNPCRITLSDGETSYRGEMVNISANGFAFCVGAPEFNELRGTDIFLSILDFPLTNGHSLEGRIIRCSKYGNKYVIGCRMPEDHDNIRHYINDNIFLKNDPA